MTFGVSLGNYPDWAEPILTSLVIHINGESYDVTDDAGYDGYNDVFSAQVTVPVEENPQSFVMYATATVEYVDYGLNLVTDTLDSRDDPNDPDGTTGDGDIVEIILSNVQAKGIKWPNRDVDKVKDHVLNVDRPNDDNPYHWKNTNVANDQGPHPAAYLKGKSPQLEFEVEPLDDSVPVRIKFVFAVSPAVTGYPAFRTSSPLSSNKTTVALPSLKDEVNIYRMTMDWTVECQRTSDGEWAELYPRAMDGRYQIDGLKLYALLATSKEPMEKPWIGVLDDACSWAAGEHTLGGVSKQLTKGLFYSGRFESDSIGRSNFTDAVDYTIFELSDFLDNLGTQPGNCMDVSSYLAICGDAVGADFQVLRLNSTTNWLDTPQATSNMKTNPICEIGNVSTNTTIYVSKDWNIHQVAYNSIGVCDAFAAQSYDLEGFSFLDPPYNWNLTAYWQATLPTSYGTAWNPVGLVKYPNPSSEQILRQYRPSVR